MNSRSTQPDPRRWLALALLGTAFFMVILDGTIVYVAVPEEESGLAAGLVDSSFNVGSALGIAVLSTVAVARADDVLAGADQPADTALAMTEGFPRPVHRLVRAASRRSTSSAGARDNEHTQTRSTRWA